jgi:hypothetical protein
LSIQTETREGSTKGFGQKEFFGIYSFVAHEHSVAELIFHIIKEEGSGGLRGGGRREKREGTLTPRDGHHNQTIPSRCKQTSGDGCVM